MDCPLAALCAIIQRQKSGNTLLDRVGPQEENRLRRQVMAGKGKFSALTGNRVKRRPFEFENVRPTLTLHPRPAYGVLRQCPHRCFPAA